MNALQEAAESIQRLGPRFKEATRCLEEAFDSVNKAMQQMIDCDKLEIKNVDVDEIDTVIKETYGHNGKIELPDTRRFASVDAKVPISEVEIDKLEVNVKLFTQQEVDQQVVRAIEIFKKKLISYKTR